MPARTSEVLARWQSSGRQVSLITKSFIGSFVLGPVATVVSCDAATYEHASVCLSISATLFRSQSDSISVAVRLYFGRSPTLFRPPSGSGRSVNNA